MQNRYRIVEQNEPIEPFNIIAAFIVLVFLVGVAVSGWIGVVDARQSERKLIAEVESYKRTVADQNAEIYKLNQLLFVKK